jgi:hypothetical protein
MRAIGGTLNTLRELMLPGHPNTGTSDSPPICQRSRIALERRATISAYRIRISFDAVHLP